MKWRAYLMSRFRATAADIEMSADGRTTKDRDETMEEQQRSETKRHEILTKSEVWTRGEK